MNGQINHWPLRSGRVPRVIELRIYVCAGCGYWPLGPSPVKHGLQVCARCGMPIETYDAIPDAVLADTARELLELDQVQRAIKSSAVRHVEIAAKATQLMAEAPRHSALVPRPLVWIDKGGTSLRLRALGGDLVARAVEQVREGVRAVRAGKFDRVKHRCLDEDEAMAVWAQLDPAEQSVVTLQYKVAPSVWHEISGEVASTAPAEITVEKPSLPLSREAIDEIGRL